MIQSDSAQWIIWSFPQVIASHSFWAPRTLPTPTIVSAATVPCSLLSFVLQGFWEELGGGCSCPFKAFWVGVPRRLEGFSPIYILNSSEPHFPAAFLCGWAVVQGEEILTRREWGSKVVPCPRVDTVHLNVWNKKKCPPVTPSYASFVAVFVVVIMWWNLGAEGCSTPVEYIDLWQVSTTKCYC